MTHPVAPKPEGIGWSKEEDDFFREYYPHTFVEEERFIFPHRTHSANLNRSKTLGIGKADHRVYLPKEYSDDVSGGYVSGLTDGEGCFAVQIAARASRSRTIYNPKFDLILRADDIGILGFLQEYFGCGLISINHCKQHKNPLATYHVGSVYDIASKVVPHFEKYQLRAKKRKDYEVWCKSVASSMRNFRRKWTIEVQAEMAQLYADLKSGRAYVPVAA